MRSALRKRLPAGTIAELAVVLPAPFGPASINASGCGTPATLTTAYDTTLLPGPYAAKSNTTSRVAGGQVPPPIPNKCSTIRATMGRNGGVGAGAPNAGAFRSSRRPRIAAGGEGVAAPPNTASSCRRPRGLKISDLGPLRLRIRPPELELDPPTVGLHAGEAVDPGQSVTEAARRRAGP